MDADFCIVGAGSSGLSAGYTLQQKGITSFTILEASSILGGRARKMDPPIADFPIDVGGEWISGDPSTIFDTMTGVDGTSEKIETVLHDFSPSAEWTGSELRYNGGNDIPWGHKFINYTWYDFLNDYIAPSVRERIIFNSPVRTIDYQDESAVRVETDTAVFQCDAVIVTVPIQTLKDGDITFIPTMPEDKMSALEEVIMPTALKVFMKFSETFYPSVMYLSKYNQLLAFAAGDDHLYYDVTFGQNTQDHVFGLFAYYRPTEDYYAHQGFLDMQTYILNELDEIFDGKASETFLDIFIQDWRAEKYMRGAYSYYGSWNYARIITILAEPFGSDRLFLAGEAIPPDRRMYGFVHTAAYSGRDAAERAVELMEKAPQAQCLSLNLDCNSSSECCGNFYCQVKCRRSFPSSAADKARVKMYDPDERVRGSIRRQRRLKIKGRSD